jgi:hypothetical protein
VEVLLVLQLL